MPEQQNTSNLIERKQYMQTLRNLKDQNIIKVITGVRRCGKSTLLEMFANELLQKGIEPAQIQSAEYYDFIVSKPPNLSKLETLAIYTTEGGITEYYKQKNISQNQVNRMLQNV